MAEPLSSLIRPDLGLVLPSFERLAPPPPDNLVAAEIESRTAPGDVVIDLHGRGGWIARSAVDRVRRAYSYESTALTKLLADLVLRPPDLRHFDATLNALTAQGHGQIGLRQAIDELYQSHCPGCGRTIVVDEFIWDGDAPAPFRKSYRCAVCRDQTGGGEQRSTPTDADDVARATAVAPGGRFLDVLRGRFPVLPDQPDLADQVLGLYTPRNQFALEALVHGVERDLRAAPIDAALRLAVVHTLLAASRLNGYPGRVAALRIRDGHVKLPGGRQWREHNPWHLFEEGCRLVRAFSQRVAANADRAVQARFGDDLLALLDGSSNVVVRRASPTSLADAPSLPGTRTGSRFDGRTRVRLVLTQPPMRWTAENLAFAYLATSIAMGAEAAATLPLEGLAGPPPRNEWGWDAAALRRSMAAVRPVLADDAKAVLLLDRSGPGGLVSGVLGGVGAGYHLVSALLAEVGDQMTGTLEFVPPGGLAPDDPRARSASGADRKPFQLTAVERAVTEVAVGVLQARGEPARFERLLGEVLVGLDRLGHLRRLVGTRTFAETEARAERSAAAVGLLSQRPAAVVAGSRNGSGPSTAASHAESGTEETPSPAGDPTDRADTATPAPADAARADADAARADADDPARADAATPAPADALAATDARATDADARDRIADPAGQAHAAADAATDAVTPALADADAARVDGADAHGRVDVDAPTSLPLGDAPGDLDGGPTDVRPIEDRAAEEDAGEPADADAELVAAGRVPTSALGARSATDHVGLLLELVLGELSRPDHPRLVELEPGRWWLRDPTDIAAARLPLSDRLEWAVFSLLSTGGSLTEASFFDRVARMFNGHDTPDHELVQACLESYRDPLSDGRLTTAEDLQARAAEHGRLVGLLAEYGHRLGLRCWIGRREQRRRYDDGFLGDLLSEQEQRVYLPLVAAGDPEALEAIDCIWYLRGKATLLWEVETTGMLAETILRRGRRIPTEEHLVRFLVIPPERAELVRLKLSRSPVLRQVIREDNWHIIKSDHLRHLAEREGADLEWLEPILGLDPEIERQGQQLALFG